MYGVEEAKRKYNYRDGIYYASYITRIFGDDLLCILSI